MYTHTEGPISAPPPTSPSGHEGGAVSAVGPGPSSLVPVSAVPLARPSPEIPTSPHPPPPAVGGSIVPADSDGYALASAVCGFTAIIPVVSQLAGLVLGIVGLVRIRRARREGRERRGVGWAMFGLVSSGTALVGWVALLAVFLWLGSTLSEVTDHLHRSVSGR